MEQITKEQTKWGFKAVVADREYSGVIMIIKEGSQTPYVYHKKRDKTWVILQGIIQYMVEKRVKLVGEGEIIHIQPGIMHRATAIKGDATILEIGTKLLEDTIIVEE